MELQPLQPQLSLAAASITVNLAKQGRYELVTITLFRPTQSTMNRMKETSYGARFDGVELRDKDDSDEWDIHSSPRDHIFLGMHAESGRKQKTQHITFLRM